MNGTLGAVEQPVKKRRYDSTRRRQAAEQTHARILSAARELFTAHGYPATSVAQIAARAQVSVDTLYTAVGRKPQLLLAVHDLELAGGRSPVAAEDRPYVQRMRAARTGVEMLTIYADALAELLPRTVPLLLALRDAGRDEPECRRVFDAVRERRAANMLKLAAELRSTGDVRADLNDQTVADLIWSTNDPDFYLLHQSRGRTPRQYANLVRDLWIRTLLRPQPDADADADA
jgi:AcrR family transcriptional regulator